jgi:hypothetical protein
MRRWYLPLTVLGLGGLGMLFATERGRGLLRRASYIFEEAPGRLAEWTDTLDQEMASIQSAVDSIASAINPGTGNSR